MLNTKIGMYWIGENLKKTPFFHHACREPTYRRMGKKCFSAIMFLIWSFLVAVHLSLSIFNLGIYQHCSVARKDNNVSTEEQRHRRSKVYGARTPFWETFLDKLFTVPLLHLALSSMHVQHHHHHHHVFVRRIHKRQSVLLVCYSSIPFFIFTDGPHTSSQVNAFLACHPSHVYLWCISICRMISWL